ncbi:MAG: hypothetical protein KDA87_13260 [Planctomycetales bacterium]|nr:hypothetical protein [Planctomycetales bacterium]
MNAAISNFDEHEFSYRNREKQASHRAPSHSSRSRAASRRRAKAPVQFNGIHRRRRKKLNW